MRRPNTVTGVLAIAAKVISHALITLTRHDLYRTTAWQSGSFKPALQLLTYVAQACATDTGISDKSHQALQALLQDTAPDKKFTKKIHQLINIQDRHANT